LATSVLVPDEPLEVVPSLEGREETPTFDEIYDTYVNFLWNGARRLGVSQGSVEDIVQQTFVIAHRRLAEFERRSSLRTWLFSILVYVVREHRRWVRRKSPHLLAEAATDPDTLPATAVDGDPFASVSRAEAVRLIEELLESLDEDKREVFVLAELEQMTAKEIAEIVGLPPAAVYSRLRAARNDFERAAAGLRRRRLLRKP
jgi:RNA polymerase sigma-70 factor, ECF subfamily